MGCATHTMMPRGRGFATAELDVNCMRGFRSKEPRVRVAAHSSRSVHVLPDTSDCQMAAVLRGGVLDASVAVEDESWSGRSLVYGVPLRRAGKLCISLGADTPTDDAPRVTLHHGCHVAPLVGHTQVGHLAHPSLIGSIDPRLSQRARHTGENSRFPTFAWQESRALRP